jgi:predicted porin
MKKIVSLLLTVITIDAVVMASAFAQSKATIYGVVNAIVRHTNNQTTADNTVHGSKTQLKSGVFQGSRLGFTGEEAIGSDTSAVFQAEMGLLTTTGASDQQGQLFGRQAFIGLKNKRWGQINLGRQYGVAFEVLGNYDPLGPGNLSENAWQLPLVGVRFDNTLKYTNTWGPITAEMQYSFGEQAGSMSIGSTRGAGLTYKNGGFSVGIFNQRSTDTNSLKVAAAGIGATLEVQSTIFYLNYINAKRDAGFSTAKKTGPLANTSMLGNVGNVLQRTDNVVTVGLGYRPTPVMAYTFGYMTDFVKNETATGDGGRVSTLYAVADYSLSKRTDVYFNIDYTSVNGGEIDNGTHTNTVLQFANAGLDGARNRTGIAIGVRTKF